MEEGDIETNIAYYCLHKFHWLPSTYTELEENEKAVVTRFVLKKMEDDKIREKELNSKVK